MEELTRRSAQYAYFTGLKVDFYKNRIKVASGSVISHPELQDLLEDSEVSYFITINKKHRFLKYLTGQIFMGYFLTYNFGAIGVAMGMLNIWLIYQTSQLLLLPLCILPISVAYFGYKMATKARRRLSKSLNKIKTPK